MACGAAAEPLPARNGRRRTGDGETEGEWEKEGKTMKIEMTTKDWIQYGTAIAMIASGIVLAFLSFFRNDGDITEGVLWYVAQALTYAGGVFGVSIYFKTKLGDFESRARQEIVQAVVEAELRAQERNYTPEKDHDEAAAKPPHAEKEDNHG